MRFEEFQLNKTLHTNRIATLVAVLATLAYFPLDQFIFPSELSEITNAVRLIAILPLLLLAYVVTFTKYRQWFYTLALSAFVAGMFTFHYVFSLGPGSEFLMIVTFCAHTQVILIACLLFHLPLNHCLVITGLSLAAAGYTFLGSTNPNGIPQVSALFTIVVSCSLLFWAYVRDQQAKKLFTNLSTLKLLKDYEDRWTKDMPRALLEQFQAQKASVKSALNALDKEPKLRTHVARASRSFDEIDTLIFRFAGLQLQNKARSAFRPASYSVKEKLHTVLIDLEAQYPNDNFSLVVESDMQTSLEGALFTRLVMNLCDNAVRHCLRGSTIELRFNRSYCLSVFNVGPQIEYSLDELVSPGLQGDNKGMYGVGLFVCKQICVDNSLLLTAHNRKDGVEFFVDFALSTPSAAPTRQGHAYER